jgi:4-hydroxybenzoate polyprenyltransferase
MTDSTEAKHSKSPVSALISIARIDHWFKNVFALPGLVLALSVDPSLDLVTALWRFAIALAGLCLVASSNYTINELLDAPTDREHPDKQHRPVASGRVRPSWAIAQWLLLGAAGLGLGVAVDLATAAPLGALWLMGVAYNLKPLRTKEHPYLDVLSESINNPIRLWLGWAASGTTLILALSILLSYWMLGAFFMAVKRLAELRQIGERARAARYRKSFAYYTEARLLISIMAYAAASAMFGGVFLTRYRIELVLAVPLAAAFFAYYLAIGLRQDSEAAHPEHLYRDWRFSGFAGLVFVFCLVLLLVDLPWLPELFNPTIPAQR